jgi:hypothetical protein
MVSTRQTTSENHVLFVFRRVAREFDPCRLLRASISERKRAAGRSPMNRGPPLDLDRVYHALCGLSVRVQLERVDEAPVRELQGLIEDEVPEAVDDPPASVIFDPLRVVRAVANDQRGARVDHLPGPTPLVWNRVEVVLDPPVHRHDHVVPLCGQSPDLLQQRPDAVICDPWSAAGRGQGAGREDEGAGKDRHGSVADLQDGRAVCLLVNPSSTHARDPAGVEKVERLRESRRPVVEEVVVSYRDHIDAEIVEHSQRFRGSPETDVRDLDGMRAAGPSDGVLEVCEDDVVARKEVVDPLEFERPWIVYKPLADRAREHDVPHHRDGIS